jgi:hypothetical protein
MMIGRRATYLGLSALGVLAVAALGSVRALADNGPAQSTAAHTHPVDPPKGQAESS